MSLLFIIAAVLVVFGVLGLAVHVLGAFIHILLVVAIAVALIQIISGRRVA